MVDMPVIVQADALESLGLGDISGKVADLAPVITVVRHTWNTQTLADILEGKVTVPDEVINESLAKYTDENSSVYDMQVTSIGDQRLRLRAKTQQFGAIDFVCRIDQFEHNKDISLLKFTVLEKDLPDQGLLSWIISRVSLSMVERIVGHIDLGDAVHTKVVGDTVAIDFHDALQNTEFGRANIFGYRLGEGLVIAGATPKDGYIEVKTALNLPDSVKGMLYNILK